MRRVFHSALLAAIATATVTVIGAAQRPVSNTNRQATLVMKSGDRHTGTLVYHNDNNFNLIENGQDRAYRIDDVAVLDFAGGDPSAAELNQLPMSDSVADAHRHVLALRDGTVVHGRMYTITPVAITFNTQNGHQDFDLNNVSRLYVSPAASRQVYASLLAAPPGAPVGTSGQPAPLPATVPAGAIQVDGARAWTDTGITVRKGDRIGFSAAGQVAFRTGGDLVGPQGSPTETSPAAPVPALGVGGLIGRVGTGAAFPIGASTQAITMPANGKLYLGINDAGVSDNSGAFVVTIVR
ncbi:MAG TPA: hypothetical protein VF921_14065 [Vicinamibacterales bacterium]